MTKQNFTIRFSLVICLALGTELSAMADSNCNFCQNDSRQTLQTEAMDQILTATSAVSDLPNPTKFDNFDRERILEWLNSEHPRGRQRIRNRIAEGNRMQYCAAAGCPTKIPFEFSKEDIEIVANEMRLARQKNSCLEDNARCERLALQYATRKMDQIVRDKKLSQMNVDEIKRRTVDRVENAGDGNDWMNQVSPGQQYLRDCVDQSANGTSFFIILGNNGLIRHHRVLSPGIIHLGPQPHWFSRISSDENRVYRFDLYRTPRTDFEKLPGVVEIERE